jgi:hypothetical protein
MRIEPEFGLGFGHWAHPWRSVNGTYPEDREFDPRFLIELGQLLPDYRQLGSNHELAVTG